MTTGDLSYDVVDVFAETPYAGNQLAVVHGADRLSDAQLVAIAREFNYSETTFPVALSRDAYRVRIFTPGGEIPFAGHPTLGTAWVLSERDEIEIGCVVQHCDAGEIPVTIDGDVVELTAAPRDLAGPLPDVTVEEVLSDLGLAPEDRDGDAWLAGTGLTFVHIPVREDAVARARLPQRSLASYDGFPDTRDPLDGINLVAFQGPDFAQVHARVFLPGVIAAEDPATGSAAAGLGLVLAASRRMTNGGSYVIAQGAEIGRPSRIVGYVDARAGVASSVRVAGRVQPVASGELRLPPG